MEFVDYALLAMLLVAVSIGVEILNRLPRPGRSIKMADRPPNYKTFAVWLHAQEPWGIEFKAGLQNEMEYGLEFKISGSADCNELFPDVERGTLSVYSDVSQDLRKSEVVGRAKANDKWLEMSVFLPPSSVAELLNFIKGEPQVLLHAQGFIDASDKIQLTYFTCEQTEAVSTPET